MKKIFSFFICFVLLSTIYISTGLPSVSASSGSNDSPYPNWLPLHPGWIDEGQSLTDYVAEWVTYPVRQIGDWFGRPSETPYYNTVNNVSNSNNTNYSIANSGNTSYTNYINSNNQFVFNNQTYNVSNVQYNSTNNIYNVQTTNNENYYITYAPTYTNITYIDSGGTMQTINYYYQLPDGRSSYNLTADEVFGVYFNYNVGLYDSVIEDDNTLGLFHLDGSLNNVSSFASALTFSSGASNTYNLHDGFGTALFLPANTHNQLNINGPANNAAFIEFQLYLTQDNNNSFAPEVSVYYQAGVVSIQGSVVNDAAMRLFPSYSFSTMSTTGNNFIYNIDTGNVISSSTITNGIRVTTRYTYAFCSKRAYMFFADGYSYIPYVTVGTFTIDVTYDATNWNGSSYTYSNYQIGNFNLLSSQSGVCLTSPTINYAQKRVDVTFVPIGVWNSIAVDTTTKQIYLNGIPYFNHFSYATTSVKGMVWQKPNFYNNYIMIDEIRCSASNPRPAGTYTNEHQPFDTNRIFVLPDSGNDGDIIIQSEIPVTSNRIGGVRPSSPTVGTVYISIDKTLTTHNVTSIQQYQSGGWVTVQGSIYNNGEWQILNNYDMRQYTLEPNDFPDDSGSDDGSNPNSGSGGNGNGNDNGNDDGNSLFDFIMDIFRFIGGLVGTLVDGVRIIFDTLTSLFDDVLLFIGNFGGFLASAFVFLPSEIITLLTLSLSLGIILMIIKYLRG